MAAGPGRSYALSRHCHRNDGIMSASQGKARSTKTREVAMTIRMVSRRRLLATVGSAAVATGLDGIARPYLSRAADRPVITHGIQSGDVSLDSGMVWARADRPSRMTVEVATTDSFKTIHGGVFVDALPESDFTAKALLENLPAGQDIFYRIRFADLAEPTILSEPMTGR